MGILCPPVQCWGRAPKTERRGTSCHSYVLVTCMPLCCRFNKFTNTWQRMWYICIPESWWSKNYFIFVCEWQKPETRCVKLKMHLGTPIVDESTDTTVHKMLVLQWTAMAVPGPNCECCSEELHCTGRIQQEKIQWSRDSVANYCNKLTNSKFNVTLTALGDAFGKLLHLCLSFQRRNLTVMEGHCFAGGKIEKLRS